jgi:amino acid transporter
MRCYHPQGIPEKVLTLLTAVWITVFLVAIIVINVFGVLGFAEEEFWSSVLKLGAVCIFMVIGLILGKCFTALIINNTKHRPSPWWWSKSGNLQRILGCATMVRSRRIQKRIQRCLLRLRHCCLRILRNGARWSRRC